MIKIFLLSDGKNPHTIKWVRALAEKDYQIFIFSLQQFDSTLYSGFSNVQSYYAFADDMTNNSILNKLIYLKTIFKIRKEIKKFNPHVVHAHYASSYGLLGALTGFKPFFISVWGTDVFEFPRNGYLQKLIFKFNMWRATRIFSTSHVMAEEIKLYTKKPIVVIPFGVNLNVFSPQKKKLHLFKETELVIGTVKTLEVKYGIQILLQAFARVKPEIQNMNPKLLIVGKGSDESEFKTLAQNLGILNDVNFTGWISVDKVPDYHNEIDISVFPSICSESFGVAVIEASACEKPVIVTRKGGLPEVVKEGKTGIIIPAENVEALAEAIKILAKDSALRDRYGKAGRAHVKANYEWNDNLTSMLLEYESLNSSQNLSHK